MTTIPRLLIAEGEGFSQRALDRLRQHFSVEVADLDRAGLLDRIGGFEWLWVRLRIMIDDDVLSRGAALRGVVTNTTGLNHLDLDAAEARGLQVLSLRGESEFLKTIRATAEHTLALALALLRRLPAAQRNVAEGHWDRRPFQGREIAGLKVGVVGYGRLGKIVADLFRAFGAEVVVCERTLTLGSNVDGMRVVNLDTLLRECELVSLHVNYEPANRHLLGSREFGWMRRGAWLVNTARGELVDERAMLEALDRGTLAGVAIDVIDGEHARGENFERLRKLAATSDRVVMTPHLGGFTVESLAATEVFLATKLIDVVSSGAGSR